MACSSAFACQAVFALHNSARPAPRATRRCALAPSWPPTSALKSAVRGKGGTPHCRAPRATQFPVACAIVTQLQTLVSGAPLDPVDSAVLTIGKIEAGTVENIIPNEAVLYGTLRTLRDDTQATWSQASSASPSTPPLRMNARRFTSTNPATPTPPTAPPRPP